MGENAGRSTAETQRARRQSEREHCAKITKSAKIAKTEIKLDFALRSSRLRDLCASFFGTFGRNTPGISGAMAYGVAWHGRDARVTDGGLDSIYVFPSAIRLGSV